MLADTSGPCLDVNADGLLNISDVVQMVEIILSGASDARVYSASEVTLSKDGNALAFTADGFVAAIQLTLSHSENFDIEFVGESMVADYRTTGSYTRMIVVAPEEGELFKATSSFVIEEAIAANTNGNLEIVMPVEFGLSTAYPNPFNPTTSVDLYMSTSEVVSVNVYSITGQLVNTLHSGSLSTGAHSFTWDASHVSSGVYFIQAATSSDVVTQKVMLLK
tara:strand:- start:381 stop:1043 length:663 start_codon:yes stop_codon:yes gene_type:complete